MSRATHYACADPHLTKRGLPGRRHLPTCPTAEGHTGSTNKCYACSREYVTQWLSKPGNRERGYATYAARYGSQREFLNQHYACELPPEAHERRRGVGLGHRRGCIVAEGHTAGASSGSAGCRACARMTERRTRRAGVLRRKYGLSIDEYGALLEEQGGVCAICKEPGQKPLPVDHDHESGQRRGLLCRNCNFALGYLRDDPKIAAEAARYLTRWKDAVMLPGPAPCY